MEYLKAHATAEVHEIARIGVEGGLVQLLRAHELLVRCARWLATSSAQSTDSRMGVTIQRTVNGTGREPMARLVIIISN